MLELRKVVIEILGEWKSNGKEWNSNKESYESKEMFWCEKYKESKEDREVHVRRYNLWIQIVCFYCMNESNHSNTGKCDKNSAISKSYEENRNGRKKHTNHRDETKDKYNECQGECIWKCPHSRYIGNNWKSDRREYSIYKGNNCLCLKNNSKIIINFSKNNAVFSVEKGEVTFFERCKKAGDTFSIDDEYVTEYQCSEELRKEYSDIFRKGNSLFCEVGIIDRAYHLIELISDSELDIKLFLDRSDDRILSNLNEFWDTNRKVLYFFCEWINKGCNDCNNGDNEENIENRNNGIEGSMFLDKKTSAGISYPSFNICKFLSNNVSEPKKEISKYKRHEKECQEVLKHEKKENQKY